MKSPLVVFILLQALDLATTFVALTMGGSESNPMIAHLMALGPVRGLLVSKALVIALAAAGASMRKNRGIWCANAVFSGVVMWNLGIITRLALIS
ncbi:conserved membrane hypothetical protein [Candidatus Sulfopaludibacter sp. SbA4]|nr:conserved membrane hypothetical protein [Candidatus Sulfopaludibacter sp. SbA4]